MINNFFAVLVLLDTKVATEQTTHVTSLTSHQNNLECLNVTLSIVELILQ